jgi:uncharacterized membrane protein
MKSGEGKVPLKKREDLTDRSFKVSLYLKGLDGLLETIGGLLLLLIKPEQINHFAHWITQGELSQDPHDFIANHILKTAHHLTGSSLIFGAAYLLSHGLVKIFLVFMVLRDKLWAYIALIAVTAILGCNRARRDYRGRMSQWHRRCLRRNAP